MYSRGNIIYYNSIVGVINYPLYSHLIGSIYIGVMIPIPLHIRSNPIAKFGYKDTHTRKYTLWYKNTTLYIYKRKVYPMVIMYHTPMVKKYHTPMVQKYHT